MPCSYGFNLILGCQLNSTWAPCAWWCDKQICGQCHPNGERPHIAVQVWRQSRVRLRIVRDIRISTYLYCNVLMCDVYADNGYVYLAHVMYEGLGFK